MPDRTKVFISYSHKDARYLERLHKHLALFEQTGKVEAWDDTKIVPGTVWRKEIEKAIKSSKVAILLVTADFLASKFIAEDELPPLLATAQVGGATILSVILKPCGFEFTRLSQFQSVNNPSKPLSRMNSHEKEEVWAKVARIVYNTTSSLKEVDINKKTKSNRTDQLDLRFFRDKGF